jgi:hypothetical protein
MAAFREATDFCFSGNKVRLPSRRRNTPVIGVVLQFDESATGGYVAYHSKPRMIVNTLKNHKPTANATRADNVRRSLSGVGRLCWCGFCCPDEGPRFQTGLPVFASP